MTSMILRRKRLVAAMVMLSVALALGMALAVAGDFRTSTHLWAEGSSTPKLADIRVDSDVSVAAVRGIMFDDIGVNGGA